MLSTETPPSTLKLPQYQLAEHQTERRAPDAGQTESIQDPEPESDTHTAFSSKSQGGDMEVINSKGVCVGFYSEGLIIVIFPSSHSGKIVGNDKAEDVCKERRCAYDFEHIKSPNVDQRTQRTPRNHFVCG